MTRQPLFVLCPGGSFSSVVCAAIGQHPQMYGLPEVNLFVRDDIGGMLDLDVPFVGINVLTGLRRAIAELKFAAQTVETVELADAWLKERRAWTGGQMFDALREMAGDRILVEKSPTNSHPDALKRLHQAYPDAFVLHLARHPRATVRSRLKAPKKLLWGRNPNLEQMWNRRHSELVAFGQSLRPGQYMYLKGEWFFEEPALVMRQVCEWLDLPCDDEALARMLRPEDSPFAKMGPENAPLGNNPGFIEKPKLRIGKIKAENLTDPIEWIEDREAHFGAPTLDLAALLGYGD